MGKSIALFFIIAPILFLSGTIRAQEKMKVAFLDVGQGDAIYIQTPNGNQMIIDGGP